MVEVIGNRVRTELLRLLADEPKSAPQLVGELGVGAASVHRHPVLLEEHGLVQADVEAGKRRGVTVRWKTVPDQVERFGQIWVEYASGRRDDERLDRSVHLRS